MIMELPGSKPLSLPEAGKTWHLHGSPPCTSVSIANQERDEEKREHGMGLVNWYLKFAMESSATSWSMEQVATPIVCKALDELLKPGSPYRNKFSYMVVNFGQHGVPQNRKRILAGSKPLIARFRRLAKWVQTPFDVIPNPRGTHLRNELFWSASKRQRVDENGQSYFGYKKYGKDDACISIHKVSHVVTARHALKWATPGTGKALLSMTPQESLSMQTFPHDYKVHKKKLIAQRGIGNSIPPIVMRQLLTGLSGRPKKTNQ